MLKPNDHGTCGGEHPCRWSREECHNVRGARDYRGEIDCDWWCQEWEPREGRCCGTCESWKENDPQPNWPGVEQCGCCQVHGGTRHEADGCDRWRWRRP